MKTSRLGDSLYTKAWVIVCTQKLGRASVSLAWARKTMPTTHARDNTARNINRNHVFTTITQSTMSIHHAYDSDPEAYEKS